MEESASAESSGRAGEAAPPSSPCLLASSPPTVTSMRFPRISADALHAQDAGVRRGSRSDRLNPEGQALLLHFGGEVSRRWTPTREPTSA